MRPGNLPEPVRKGDVTYPGLGVIQWKRGFRQPRAGTPRGFLFGFGATPMLRRVRKEVSTTSDTGVTPGYACPCPAGLGWTWVSLTGVRLGHLYLPSPSLPSMMKALGGGRGGAVSSDEDWFDVRKGGASSEPWGQSVPAAIPGGLPVVPLGMTGSNLEPLRMIAPVGFCPRLSYHRSPPYKAFTGSAPSMQELVTTFSLLAPLPTASFTSPSSLVQEYGHVATAIG